MFTFFLELVLAAFLEARDFQNLLNFDDQSLIRYLIIKFWYYQIDLIRSNQTDQISYRMHSDFDEIGSTRSSGDPISSSIRLQIVIWI